MSTGRETHQGQCRFLSHQDAVNADQLGSLPANGAFDGVGITFVGLLFIPALGKGRQSNGA